MTIFIFFLGVCMNIKTVLLFVMLSAFLLTFVPNESLSQRVVRNYNESITANPLALAFGILPINYEMQVSRDNSLTLGAVYLGYQEWTGVAVSGIYKWYSFQEQELAIKGFGFGPYLSVGYIGYVNDTYDNRLTLAIGAEASYKWIVDDLVLEPVLNVNYNVLNDDGMEWRFFFLGVNLGYAW